MIPLNSNLIKEVRETANWLLEFPDKLVSAILKPQENYLKRSARIKKLKEIVELREIAKEIQSLYFIKGSLSQWLQEIQLEGRVGDIVYVRELFQNVSMGIAGLKETVADSSVSDSKLGAEAAMALSRAEVVYNNLADLPDEALLNDRAVVEIGILLEKLNDAASSLLEKLDEHRKFLDHCYGN